MRLNNRSGRQHFLLSMALCCGLLLPFFAHAAAVDLATTPLTTSTTSVVKPNVLFVLDDSGSMTWTYLPDIAGNFRTKYGYHSSQCNAVYYNPDITYNPPLDASGNVYADAVFTAARDNGFDDTTTTRDLNSAFIANRFVPESANSTYSGSGSYLGNSGAYSLGPYGAFYYAYSGSQTSKTYSDTSSTFYTECNTSIGSATSVFSKRRLSTDETTTITVSGSSPTSTSVSSIKVNGVELLFAASTASTSTSVVAANIAAQINLKTTTSGFSAVASGSVVTITGPTSAANYTPVITKASGNMTLTTDVFPDTTPAKLTNFANWYSFYRTRMQMMKTSAGRAFSQLDNSYRIGLMRINSSDSTTLAVGDFEGTQRSSWYSDLYSVVPSSGTPLRKALANAGRYYAGKLSGDDPVQYSCQQNFTILSSDGYWNGDAGFKVNGSTAVGNQDGPYSRPYNDGAQSNTTVTITYTRNYYTRSSSGCWGGKRRLKTQPQIGACSVSVTTVTGSESCTPGSWTNSGSATYGTCVSSVTLPVPNPSVKVVSERVETAGSSGGTSDTLADVAMYYYQTDLRTPALGNCGTPVAPATVGPLCENNVFVRGDDNNLQQHMTTFTLGLGASGKMLYSPSYLVDNAGDYFSVKLGSTTNLTSSPKICSWQAAGTACTWPIPGSDKVENVDDMWHAAVNGRGAYFSATDPTSLAAGLSNALAGIGQRRGSAAAAATSTLNPVSDNNYAYVASYTTQLWKGNLEARGINTETGVFSETANWCVENVAAGNCASPGTILAETEGDVTIYNCVTPNATTCYGGILDGTNCKVQVATSCSGTMRSMVSDSSDTRTIKTAGSGNVLVNFDAAYATTNPDYFSADHISTLSQWSSLSSTQKALAAGSNLIKFLRGQYGYEDRSSNDVANRLYRYREAVLGDALESQPAYMSKPVFSYPYAGYSAYAAAQASRAGTVYMGTNEGMMHAFAADTGIERWAYVPSMVIPKLWKLADKNYEDLHTNYVNGSPIISDICTANCSNSDYAATASTADDPVWKTILVAGLNAGGRGYYALDITNPVAPALLWEFTTSGGIGVAQDDDLGYTYGQPVITRKADGTWVVLLTSGYNNTSPGTGKGFLYVLNAGTGAIISKIATGVGSTTTPSGLAKISAWNTEATGNRVSYVYGGDLLGNVWRFDINSTASAAIGTGSALKFATLFSDTGATQPQPVTTTPVLGKVAEKRVVFIGTGKYLETSDLTNVQKQTQYAIKDDDATATLVNPRTSLVAQSLANNPDGTATRLSTSTNTVNFYSGRGWYFDFPDSGERANTDSKLVQGTLLVPTTVPSNTACSPGGYGWLNFIDYKTGRSVDSTNLVSVKYDSPIVGLNVIYIQGVPKVAVVTSNNPTPTLDEHVLFGSSAAGFVGKRVLWRELIP